MKKSIYIVGALALSLLASSCNDDFLDVEPTEQLSPEQIAAAAEKDPSLLNGNIAGLYSTMYNTGTGGTDLDHDDFGQKGYDIYSDMLSSDMALAGVTYGWYSRIARYQATVNNTDIGAYKPWRYYYRIIFGANTVIDALGGTDAEQTEPLKRHIMGQAKAMRGYAYFYLAQFYAKGYGSGSEKILPIYVDTKVPNQPKSTSEEVYNLIIDDLTQAVTYLEDFNRTSKDQINKDVAKALLAYAHAARGTQEDLNKVVTLTNDVITTGGFRITNENELVAKFDPETGALLNTESGFNNVGTPSWMWGVDLTLANGLDLVSWWGQMDYYTYSYAWAGDAKIIDKNLFDAIKTDDLRKKQFHSTGRPLYKFFDLGRKAGGQRQITTDYVYMRIEEMYLLNAEAHARLGQDGMAKDRLKELVSQRMPDASYVDALSGQALLDEIYLQTRIELWGEGKAYLAMKRLKKNVTRGANHLFEAGSTFAWDSDELTFPIPQAEVLNNPQLEQ
ncbi:RagB/SusD family nutrient uptake outer membrane protein [Pontibacter oryzae]|uniref:RagB/SusD family nutrient uptake outer membrane protein n=1 Tax=Pontibacter oryzae TaxID=2304593 RepID=A0A399S1Y6_9BACT|nr:RagB/SusD family nutrient uptake outer membrane protein [Pontibacter oryzae]RIJ36704.1 RagB/SusD family nutrient uptake outer membrane protein [Pontibacter oryzae]